MPSHASTSSPSFPLPQPFSPASPKAQSRRRPCPTSRGICKEGRTEGGREGRRGKCVAINYRWNNGRERRRRQPTRTDGRRRRRRTRDTPANTNTDGRGSEGDGAAPLIIMPMNYCVAHYQSYSLLLSHYATSYYVGRP